MKRDERVCEYQFPTDDGTFVYCFKSALPCKAPAGRESECKKFVDVQSKGEE
jgi:hypothetical protein